MIVFRKNIGRGWTQLPPAQAPAPNCHVQRWRSGRLTGGRDSPRQRKTPQRSPRTAGDAQGLDASISARPSASKRCCKWHGAESQASAERPSKPTATR